jgi:hypothetical protein
MFTATKIGHTDDVQTQRRTVVIQFTDGVTEFSKPFSFRLTDTVEVMKKAVASYLAEINANEAVIPDDTTDFTVAPPIETPPTQAELDRTAWDLDVARVKKAQELIDCGVTFTAGQMTALATIRGRIATNFKAEYLA